MHYWRFEFRENEGVGEIRKIRGHGATMPNPSVERDRQRAALVGSLRGYAAPAAPHLKR